MQIVTSNDGVVFIRDDIKAPAWSMDAPLGFLGEVRGYRRVAVIGTVSDYSGDNSEKYRQFARKALKHADLAIFVGPHAHRAVRAKADPDDKSLLGFKTAREAALYLRSELKKGDMVLLKGSNKVDHLERLFLDRNSPIQCWREQCKKSGFCPACPGFHETTPHQSRSESISESSELASNNPAFSSKHDNSEQARRIVIAGLGNPGPVYDDTPHNVGHHLLDTMANASERQWETTLEGLTCTVSINGVSVCLFKPSANMNVCGPKILEFLQRVGSDPSHCMIVHDDMDLALGIVRLKRDGGDAGHRGVRSVVTALGTDAILRVRIGVRRPGDTEKAIHRVLARFTEQDREALNDSLERGAAMIMQHLPQPAKSG
jgi:aminoacyl-tRNA hydrolase